MPRDDQIIIKVPMARLCKSCEKEQIKRLKKSIREHTEKQIKNLNKMIEDQAIERQQIKC